MKILRTFLQFLFFLGLGSVILFFVYRSQNEAHLNDCCVHAHPEWLQLESEQQRADLLAECLASGFPEENCPPLLDKLVNDFGEVRYGWIGLVLLAFILSNLSRTAKWKMLLAPMGYRPRFINGFLSILVGYAANLLLPRMGEVVRAATLARVEKIPVEKVMGTIVIDRVTDVLCLGLAFLAALFFESEKILGYMAISGGDGEEEAGLSWKLVILAVLALAAGLVFLFRKKLMQSALFRKVQNVLLGFWEGIKTVSQLERPWLFVLHSLNIWFLFFLMTWLGFKAFEPTAHLGLQAALTVFIFGTLGFIIPSPGGMGTFQGLVTVALTTFYGISNADAFSAANIIFFTVQVGANSLLGILALILLPIVNRGRP